MKFKKLLALGAALVFSVAFIAGCGSNNSDNGAKKEFPTVNPRVLTLNCLKKVLNQFWKNKAIPSKV